MLTTNGLDSTSLSAFTPHPESDETSRLMDLTSLTTLCGALTETAPRKGIP